MRRDTEVELLNARASSRPGAGTDLAPSAMVCDAVQYMISYHAAIDRPAGTAQLRPLASGTPPR